jgi:hypothetical protein
MSIKIIKPGKKPDTTKRFECTSCGCTFEGEREDYRIIYDTATVFAAAMRCPTCGARCYRYETKIRR